MGVGVDVGLEIKTKSEIRRHENKGEKSREGKVTKPENTVDSKEACTEH